MTSDKENKQMIAGIVIQERNGFLETLPSNFRSDWDRLEELKSSGQAERVGWGIAYEAGGHTFVNFERVETDPVTIVQTEVNWFYVTPTTGIVNSHNAPSPLPWDPREDSSDFDPDELY